MGFPNVTKEDKMAIVAIAKRAEEKDLLRFDRMSLIMDLEFVHGDEGTLRLQDLLNADDYNFAHDVVGIQNHFNRETKKLENLFLPRYTKSAN